VVHTAYRHACTCMHMTCSYGSCCTCTRAYSAVYLNLYIMRCSLYRQVSAQLPGLRGAFARLFPIRRPLVKNSTKEPALTALHSCHVVVHEPFLRLPDRLLLGAVLVILATNRIVIVTWSSGTGRSNNTATQNNTKNTKIKCTPH
jgi:hypothetical protein